MHMLRRVGARTARSATISSSGSMPSTVLFAALPRPPALLATATAHRGLASSTTSVQAALERATAAGDTLDIPPTPTASEINATIAAAEAAALHAQLAKRVQHMPIRAVHVARKMDIVALFQTLYTDRSKVAHYLHNDSIVLQLKSGNAVESTTAFISSPSAAGTTTTTTTTTATPHQSDAPMTTTLSVATGNLTSRRARDKWVVYFDFGAVVFFNCDPPLVATLTKHATTFCSDVLVETATMRERRNHDDNELLLVCNPLLDTWSKLVENHVLVRKVDHVNIHVIAGVLAQTVALEHYERQVEAILTEFEKLNTSVERNGPRGALVGSSGIKQTEAQQHKQLFKIVATNNTLLIDLVSKLRVIDRKRPGDAAWSHTRYHTMWESLLDEFELNERFNNLNFKLELIQHNTKFFLEVLTHHKGERLEWYVIILVAAELALGLYELLEKLM